MKITGAQKCAQTSARARILLVVIALALVAGCGGQDPAPRRTTTKPSPSASVAPTTAPADARPNIMVIEADDMRVDELRWMPNVRTLIGERGLTFENSFAPYPLCCPSRASFLTGKYAHNHKVLSHVDPFGFRVFQDKTTLATTLQAGGYRTALVGKYLNGYGQQTLVSTGESSLLYVPPGWTDWYAGTDHLWKRSDPIQGGTYQYFRLAQNINGKIKSFPGAYSAGVMGAQTRALTTKYTDEAAPWFIWWTPVAPHAGGPREPDDPPPLMRSDGKEQLFNTPARPSWVKGKFDAEITHGLGTPAVGSAEADTSDKPAYISKLPQLTDAEKDAETNLSRQRAESLFVLDRQIGLTIKHLKAIGAYDNTVIAFTSDNGYYLGEHLRRATKLTLHEPSLRVPFLIAGPGIPKGKRYDPISTVDLAPTFLAYAGVKPMPGIDGIDMIPTITDGDSGWTRPVVMEARMPDYPVDTTERALAFDGLNDRGLRLGRWKYTAYSTGEAELYDLQADPLEFENLIIKPQYAAMRARMEKLWKSYENCVGEECAKQVPKDLRVGTKQNVAITDNMDTLTRAFFK